MKRKTLAVMLVVMVCVVMVTGCGEKECEHEWTEANYQTPATCTICDAVDGEVLPATYADTEVPMISPEAGAVYSFTTACYDDKSYTTTGELSVISYDIIDSDESHEYKEGYEWRILETEVFYSDENAYNYGISPTSLLDDYYDTDLFSDTINFDFEDHYEYMANYNGVDMPVYIYTSSSYGGWINETNTNYTTISYHVPVGYDGALYAFANSGLVIEDGFTFDEIYKENEVIIFRFDGQQNSIVVVE